MGAVPDTVALLGDWRAGNQNAYNALFDLLYGDMRKKASLILNRDWVNAKMCPTELVHESALRLIGLQQLDCQSRAHFLALAATAMRQVLIDDYRKQIAGKRQHTALTLQTSHLANATSSETIDFDTLENALSALESVSPQYAQVVVLKFFAGMTHEEIAEVTGVAAVTVKRHWRAARAWMEIYLTENG